MRPWRLPHTPEPSPVPRVVDDVRAKIAFMDSQMDLEIMLANREHHAQSRKALYERGDRSIAHKPRRQRVSK